MVGVFSILCTSVGIVCRGTDTYIKFKRSFYKNLWEQLHDRTSELSKIEAVYNVNWARGATDGAASLKMKRTDF